jgi:hypothetical protein
MSLDMDTVKVGTQVMCINGYDINPGTLNLHPIPSDVLSVPRQERIYTVRQILTYPSGKGLLFLEVQNPAVMYPRFGLCEPCWDPDRFELVEPPV